MTEMSTLELIVTDNVEEGDHDKFSHYVQKTLLMDAMIYGTPLAALCGKKWVPTRDGLKFPVCPECKEIWESLPSAG